MKYPLFWLALISSLSSCNIYSRYVAKQRELFEEVGMKQYERISDRPGPLFSGETYIEFKTVYMTAPEQFDSKKKTLLLIHGYQGGAIGQWSHNIEELSKYFNIIAPDLNYHGKTYFQSDFSLEMQVDLVNEMLSFNSAKWSTENLIVIGSSYGGLVGARFAEKYAEKVSAYVSYDGLTGCYNPSFTDSVAKSVGSENATAFLNPTTGRGVKKLNSLDKPVRIPSFILKQAAEQHFKINRIEKIALLEYLNKHEGELNAHRFKWSAPVYILWGRNDKIIPFKAAICLKEQYQIPDSRFIVYENTGHVMNMQNPKAFNKWVIETFSN
jgi:pimeloyl-ACP methyl ester carboxylesterase